MTDAVPEEQQPLPLPTMPENTSVTLSGFADDATAERFGNTIGGIVSLISRYINVERLDGITVAYDYDKALAELDRGCPATRPLTRTASDQLAGVAMAPAVLRHGAVKAHMVFYAPSITRLEEPETEGFRQALYLVAHECGHVEDLKYRDEAFPGTILQAAVSGYEDAVLKPAGETLWEEYAASRVSAKFHAEQAAIYEQSLVSVLGVAQKKANEAIRAYRLHGDTARVLDEAGPPLCEPLRLAAYLFGHLDGLGVNLDYVPQARDMLVGSPYAAFVATLWAALKSVWFDRGHWDSRAQFDQLKNTVCEVLAMGGMVMRRLPDGTFYVDIPFTLETIPQ